MDKALAMVFVIHRLPVSTQKIQDALVGFRPCRYGIVAIEEQKPDARAVQAHHVED